MNRIKRGLMTLACLSTLLQAVPAHAARDVAGIRFEDQCNVANQALVLNGAGVRVKMIIKVYAVGLYVPRKDTAAGAILNQSGAKSVRIVMLRDVSGDKLAEALVTGVTDNLAAAERVGLQPRLEQLENAMRNAGQASRGAQIQIDYLPGVGTHITMGGKPLGKDIAGEDFYRALLMVWLGEHPSDRSLKSDLLGLS
ncbi:MAG: chalcone isomerase family protein [Aquabacterium sp.]